MALQSFIALTLGSTNAYYYSYDGINYTTTTFPYTETWSGAAFTGSEWFVIGSTRTLKSSDGISWTVANATHDGVNIIYGNGSLISFKNTTTNNVSYSTNNGTTWTTYLGGITNTATSISSKGIAYGNNIFVVKGDGLYYSTNNGASWGTSDAPNYNWEFVIYDGSRFVACATQGYVYYSTNGINWVNANYPVGAGVTGFAYGNGYYVALNSVNGNVRYTSNLSEISTWSTATIASGTTWRDLSFSNGIFTAVGTTSNCMYATIPTTWTSGGTVGTTLQVIFGRPGLTALTNAETICTPIGVKLNKIYKSLNSISTSTSYGLASTLKFISSLATSITNVVKNNNISSKFNALSTSTGGRIISYLLSVSGTATSTTISNIFSQFNLSIKATATSITTASRSIPKFWLFPWSMLWDGVKWVGVKMNSALAATSTDGEEWTSQTLPSTSKWACIANNGTINVAIATDGTIAASSPDGITWTARTMPTSRIWRSVVAGGTRFVAVALNSDKCAVSDDGITWVEYSMPAKRNWTSVAWNSTKFCAVSTDGKSATSTDGITWTEFSMPDVVNYASITWALDKFMVVATGPTNLAASSTDGETWTRVTMPFVGNWTAIGPGVGNPDA